MIFTIDFSKITAPATKMKKTVDKQVLLVR